MNILSLENVSKNYGVKPLFENVSHSARRNAIKSALSARTVRAKRRFCALSPEREEPDTGASFARRENARLSRAKSAD
jgi:hypothetical protein